MFKPAQFGKYYLTERIAVGGMAELFRATLFGIRGFEKPMVVKQILPKYSKNDEFIRMFVDEAKIAVTLTHGNIVPVYELGRIDGIYFIAMEYIHGRDLAEILETARARNLPLSPEHASYITIEICKGLGYAHRRTDPEGRPLRVIHRDISPPNILISFDGEVKIADFGIAKAAHKLGNTEAGVVKGTFGYMSPEQVRGLPLDHHTDIFSAGILLHEMLTGRRLFTGESEMEAIERVKLTRVPAPSSLNPRVPAAIDPIVFKALAREPSDRFADANEFQLALSRFLFTAGKGATASTLSRYLRELFADELGKEHAPAPLTPAPEAVADYGIDEPTHREGRPRGLRSADSQSFAVNPELDRASRGSDNGRRRQVMDVGAGAPIAVNATLALPSLETDPGGPPDFGDEERTAIFEAARQPPRPEVPEIRFPPKPPSSGVVPFPMNPAPEPDADDFPSGDELAALADQLAETPRPKKQKPRTSPPPPEKPRSGQRTVSPAPAAAPAVAPQRPITKDRRASGELPRRASGEALSPIATEPSPGAQELEAVPPPAEIKTGPTRPNARAADSDLLIHLLTQQSGGQPLVTDPSEELPARAEPPASEPAKEESKEASRRAPTRRVTPAAAMPAARRADKTGKNSGLLSATMRLFVEGFDDEAPAADASAGRGATTDLSGAVRGADGLSPYTTDNLEVPRTIKPTVFGWIIIGLVVVGAGLFVLYKKTHLFGPRGADESGEVLKPEDIRQGELARPSAKGTIRIAAKTPGASFYYFSGETPCTLSLDMGESHLIRVERDGFQTVHRVIQPSELAKGNAELQVTLQPVGAGAKDGPFDFEESGSKTGKNAVVRVRSEPPVAMVWLLKGRGKLEMEGVDTNRTFNFKVVAADHPSLLVNVAPADFDKISGVYSTAVTLEEEAKAEPKDKDKDKDKDEQGKAESKDKDKDKDEQGKAEPKDKDKDKDSKKAAPKDEEGKAEPKAEPKAETKKRKGEPTVKLKTEPKPKVHPKTVRPRIKVKAPKKATPAVTPPPKKKPASKGEPGKIQTPDWAR